MAVTISRTKRLENGVWERLPEPKLTDLEPGDSIFLDMADVAEGKAKIEALVQKLGFTLSPGKPTSTGRMVFRVLSSGYSLEDIDAVLSKL